MKIKMTPKLNTTTKKSMFKLNKAKAIIIILKILTFQNTKRSMIKMKKYNH